MTDLVIRPLVAADWPAVEAIYREGIEGGNATFESAPPTWEQFDADKVAAPRLVAELDGVVVGWVAAAPVSDRCVYGGVVDHSVYVASSARGRGIARALLERFVAEAEQLDLWTVQSGIFPENAASLTVHAAAGFRVVGTRERVGRMGFGPYAGQWRDLVLVERRSSVAGSD